MVFAGVAAMIVVAAAAASLPPFPVASSAPLPPAQASPRPRYASTWLACDDDVAWVAFRAQLVENAASGFPENMALLEEAERLLAASSRNLRPEPSHSRYASWAMRGFFERCHFAAARPAVPGACLYGAVSALWVKARHRPALAATALELAEGQLGGDGLGRCLDFMDVSPWPLSGLDVLANLQAARAGAPFRLPAALRAQFDLLPRPRAPAVWSSGARPPASCGARWRQPASRELLRVWEAGVHGPLSAEALGAIAAASRPWASVSHRNLVHTQYPEGLPKRCDQFYGPSSGLACDRGIEDELTAVIQAYLPGSGQGLQSTISDPRGFAGDFASVAWRRLAEVDLLLCTVAVLCTLFFDLGKPTIAFLAHRMEFLTSAEDASDVRHALAAHLAMWGFAIVVDILDAGRSLLVDALAAEGRAAVVMPLSLYTGLHAPWSPRQQWHVLVRDRHNDCVLLCLLRDLAMEVGSRVRFVSISETARTFQDFATYRAVVFFPDNQMQLAFFEFYAMAMPMFLPNDVTAHWNPSLHGDVNATLASMLLSPYVFLPHVRRFGSLVGLLTALAAPMASLRRSSAAMRRAYRGRLAVGLREWASVLQGSLGAARTASPCVALPSLPRFPPPAVPRWLVPAFRPAPSALPARPEAVTTAALAWANVSETVQPCLVLVDLTRYDCGGDWDALLRRFRRALAAPTEVGPAVRAARLAQWASAGECLVGDWFLRVLVALRRPPSALRRQLTASALKGLGGLLRRLWAEQALVAEILEQQGLSEGVTTTPELFLGSRWPVWPLLRHLAASPRRSQRRALRRGDACHSPRWRLLAACLATLGDVALPSLTDVAARRLWRRAIAVAGRLVAEEGEGGGCSCPAGLLCAVLLTCLQLASRSCLQARPDLDAFAAERAFLEARLRVAASLLARAGASALVGSVWPAFVLLDLLGRLQPEEAAVLDGGPRHWVVGGARATLGDNFMGSVVLTRG